MILLTILVLTTAAVIFFGIKEADPTAILALLFIGCFGWGILGSLVPTSKSEVTIKPYTVIHDDKACYITEDGKTILTYTDYITYTYLVNRTNVTVKKTIPFNMYGGEAAGKSYEIVKD